MVYYGIKCATIKNAGTHPISRVLTRPSNYNLFVMKKLLRPGLLLLSGICLLVSCSKEHSLETGSGGTPATGLLVKDEEDNCLPATIHGSYNAGEAVTDSNYVEMTVTITKPGTYYISTDQQNGVSFADSGYFAIIGTRTLKLGAIGTPILPITTDFTVLFDTSACAFSINVSDGSSGTDPNKSLSAWQFSNGTSTYQGYFDTAFFSSQTIPGTPPHDQAYLTLSGHIASNANPGGLDSTFGLVLALPVARTVTVGATFHTLRGAATNDADFSFSRYNPLAEDIYYSYPVASPAPDAGDMTITITGYNSTTRVVDGIFNGRAIIQSSGGNITISNGKFKARISTL
jgi:hypothetical protein